MLKGSEESSSEKRYPYKQEKYEKMLYCIVIGRMQIKTTVRYLFKPITVAKFESGNTKHQQSGVPIITTMCYTWKCKLYNRWGEQFGHMDRSGGCACHAFQEFIPGDVS